MSCLSQLRVLRASGFPFRNSVVQRGVPLRAERCWSGGYDGFGLKRWFSSSPGRLVGPERWVAALERMHGAGFRVPVPSISRTTDAPESETAAAAAVEETTAEEQPLSGPITVSGVGWGGPLRPGTTADDLKGQMGFAADIAGLSQSLPLLEVIPFQHLIPEGKDETHLDRAIQTGVAAIDGSFISVGSLDFPPEVLEAEVQRAGGQRSAAVDGVLKILRGVLRDRLGKFEHVHRTPQGGGESRPAVDVLLLQNPLSWFEVQDPRAEFGGLDQEKAEWILEGLEKAVEEGLIGGYGIDGHSYLGRESIRLDHILEIAERGDHHFFFAFDCHHSFSPYSLIFILSCVHHFLLSSFCPPASCIVLLSAE